MRILVLSRIWYVGNVPHMSFNGPPEIPSREGTVSLCFHETGGLVDLVSTAAMNAQREKTGAICSGLFVFLSAVGVWPPVYLV